MFEVSAILLCAFAISMVLLPLSKRREIAVCDDEQEFLKTQMMELEQRLAARDGNVAVLEEERAEIGRRLLKVTGRQDITQQVQPIGRGGLTVVSLISIIAIPLVSAAIYFTQGAPGANDAPLAQRAAGEIRDLPINQLVARAEKQLKKNPDDLRGWTVLESVYGRLGRTGDRRNALANIIRLDGETADRLSLLAELNASLVDNVITTQSKQLLLRARSLDPQNVRTNFLLAVAAEQEGDVPTALSFYQGLLSRAETGSALEPVLKSRIAELRKKSGQGSVIPKLDQETIDQAQSLSTEEKADFIRSMVDRLANRLHDAPDDATGWERLIKAYLVLEDIPNARSALNKAKGHFRSDDNVLARLKTIESQLQKQESPGKVEQ